MQTARMFLDASGSAPMTNRTLDAFHAGLADGWADPARLHTESRRARQLVDGAREAIAEILGSRPEQTHLTHSPHVGIERVIAGVDAARRGRERIVAAAIERDAVLHAAEYISGGHLTTVAVDAAGHVDPDALLRELEVPDVSLLAVQHGNHEIGTVQRLDRVADLAAVARVPLVVDATATIGHVEAPEHWDALVANPADWGGPAGLGVVALRPQTRWLPVWPEGDDWAPGGISVPAALAAAVALQERAETLEQTSTRLAGLIDTIRARAATWPGVDVVGDPVERLPHVLTFSCLYVDGEALTTELDKEGFAVGSGSACTAGTLEPSHVLAAMGVLTHGNVRLALDRTTTEQDVERFLAVLPGAVARVRRMLGVEDL